MSDWSPFANDIMSQRYAWPGETWKDVAHRVSTNVMSAVPAPTWLVKQIERYIAERKFMPGGRYLYASGRGEGARYTNNCFLMRAEDSREGWGRIVGQVMMASMTGGGVGVVYSDLREAGASIKRTGGTSSGPLALMQAVNEIGRGAMQGGTRRAALWAGLHWNHPDVMQFIRMKDWPEVVKQEKLKNSDFPAVMDGTNISVILDDAFFDAYDRDIRGAREVYWAVVRNMCETGEPGFSIDVGDNEDENLRNPCCEITSRDDSDVCCIGSINLARVGNLSEMQELVSCATAFLTAGTIYSDLPFEYVGKVREKNRRLGLGLLGVHEWLLRNGSKYGDIESLVPYLETYELSTYYAHQVQREWGLSQSIKTRAIAPTGTIGIVAETTTGIEPMFCAAYRRRYDHGKRFQYVVDPTARRLMAQGVSVEKLEDAYSLSRDIERRVRFQAEVQAYVDHGISSTLNLPAWGSPENNEDTVKPFGEMLLKYLPKLRGITVYPDGARGGQPLTPCDITEALNREGEVLTEQADVCDLTRAGSCGA